jgi:putative chitinase
MIRQFLSRIRQSKHSAREAAPAKPILPPTFKAANEAINALPPEPKFDRAAFFARLREGPLRHHSEAQVKGTEAILDAMEGSPISWVAYALATAWHETGGNMTPNRESLNYSINGLLASFGRHRISRADAEKLGRKPGEGALSELRQRAIANILYGGSWGRENLGNTEPDDGWVYRGRGMCHDTGRRNYDLSGKAVGIDLLAYPDALLDVTTAAKVMATGMKTGRYTGKGFVHFLPSKGEASAQQFGSARQIINGRDKMAEVAAYALTFQRALVAGGWE